MDDMDHVLEFLKGLADAPTPHYRKLIESRLKGFKHWNPDKVGLLHDQVDQAFKDAYALPVSTVNFELESLNRRLDVLGEARKNLS